MVNIHLNGDIIRCPDIAAIKAQLNNTRYQHFICGFGVQQFFCEHWRKYNREILKKDSNPFHCHCPLSTKFEIKNGARIYYCKKAQERYDNSKKTKSFRITNDVYRQISSAGHYMLKTSKFRTLFLLLSFPPWKNNFNPYKNEKKLNECFSKFAENLRKNYNCQGYIAVRELGEQNRRYHYHFLCSIPFVPFADLNAAWCAAISDICDFSKNAVSSDPGNRLIERNNPGGALRYVCKYISKAKNQCSRTRIIFISNNILRGPVKHSIDQANIIYSKTGIMDIEKYLLTYKSLSIVKLNDYCTAFRINSHTDFDKICTELIYPIFNLTDEIKADFYAFPNPKPG